LFGNNVVCENGSISKKINIRRLNSYMKNKTIEINEIESEMLKNFYKDSKKVDNKKMKTFFNYSLKFPTYVEGLNHIFNNNI